MPCHIYPKVSLTLRSVISTDTASLEKTDDFLDVQHCIGSTPANGFVKQNELRIVVGQRTGNFDDGVRRPTNDRRAITQMRYMQVVQQLLQTRLILLCRSLPSSNGLDISAPPPSSFAENRRFLQQILRQSPGARRWIGQWVISCRSSGSARHRWPPDRQSCRSWSSCLRRQPSKPTTSPSSIAIDIPHHGAGLCIFAQVV